MDDASEMTTAETHAEEDAAMSEAFHRDDHKTKPTPVFTLLVISVVLNAVALLVVGWAVWLVLGVTRDTNKTVGFIDKQTNPEAIKAQQEFLDGVYIRIDCDGQFRDQREIDGLVQQGLIHKYTVVTNDCQNRPTTTTTTP